MKLFKQVGWFDYLIFLSIILLSFSYVVPSLIRNILYILLIGYELFRFYARSKSKSINKNLHKSITIILLVLFVSLSAFEIRFRLFLDNINNSQEEIQFEFVALNNLNIQDVSELNQFSLGLLEDKSSKIGYLAPHEFLDQNEIKMDEAYYQDYVQLIHALINEEVEVIVLPFGYENTFSENSELADFMNQIHIIYSASILLNVESVNINTDILNIVFIGGDNPIVGKSTAGFNYDVIVVYSVNFKTHESAMMSIPRDSYVYTSCSQKMDKITHSGWYGASCLTDTLSGFLDIDINNYMLIDFKGLISLVDSLGGVWIDVEYKIDEQDENRDFENMIHIDPGYQLLDGQHALAFLRHRKTLAGGANTRSDNHEKFLIALMEQLAQTSSIFKINGLISALQDTALTNISSSNMSEYYQKALSFISSVGVGGIVPEQTSLSGYGDMIYTPSFKADLYYYVLDEASVQQAREVFQAVQD